MLDSDKRKYGWCCPTQCNDTMGNPTHPDATPMTRQSQWTSTPQCSLECLTPTVTKISNVTWSKDFALDVERKDTKHASVQTERSSFSRWINITRKEPLVLHLVDHHLSNAPTRQGILKVLESLINLRQGTLMHMLHP